MALPTGEITLDMEPSGVSLQPTIITHSKARTNHYTTSGGNPSSSTEPIPIQHSNPGQKCYTALHYAAIGGSLRSAKALLGKNPKLTQRLDSTGRTALLLAATFASENKELEWYFLLVTKHEKPGLPSTGPLAANLVNVLIASGFPVHWLRQMLFGAIKRTVELLRQICLQLSQEQIKSDILKIAATNGIVEFIRTLVEFFPDLMWFILSKDRYLLLPFAIEFRHENLFRIVCGKTARSKLIASTLLESESGGTILHLAAKLAPLPQLSSVSCLALQMQRELQWFKVVEKLVHPYYKDNLNEKGETARELFTKEHKESAERGEKWLKDTSNSCMLVATLIATVVLAAAFTVPGGNDNDGAPNLLWKNSSTFMVFVVSDAIALFASLTSLLMFLSILTALYAEEDFLQSLSRRLIIGLASLFLAIASMMVAFGATIELVLNNRFNWVSITITSLATCLVTLFAMLQLPWFIQMVRLTFGQSIFRPENIGNSMDLCKKDA
ncbi:hypothetical protein ACE6H2_025090 [Prunus campanulata]